MFWVAARRLPPPPPLVTVSVLVPSARSRSLDRLGRAVADRDQQDHRGDADQDAEHGQAGAQLVGARRRAARTGRSRARLTRLPPVPLPRRPSTIWPSTSRITRRACAATSASWVISTIVRPGAVEPVEDGQHVRGGLRVQVAGRLVGEQQRRRGDQRPGHRDPLLLAAGELVRLVVGPVGQPDQRPARPAPGSRRSAGLHPGVRQRQLHVGQRAWSAGSG